MWWILYVDHVLGCYLPTDTEVLFSLELTRQLLIYFIRQLRKNFGICMHGHNACSLKKYNRCDNYIKGNCLPCSLYFVGMPKHLLHCFRRWNIVYRFYCADKEVSALSLTIIASLHNGRRWCGSKSIVHCTLKAEINTYRYNLWICQAFDITLWWKSATHIAS